MIELAFQCQMSTFSRNSNHHWKCRDQKRNFQTIVVIIFWNYTIFQYRSNSLHVKRNFISSIANLVYELPHELSKNLRLRILGNQGILEKSQVLVKTKPSAQSLFFGLFSGNSNRKSPKNGYQTFPLLSNITGFLYFVPNFCPGLQVQVQNNKNYGKHQATYS